MPRFAQARKHARSSHGTRTRARISSRAGTSRRLQVRILQMSDFKKLTFLGEGEFAQVWHRRTHTAGFVSVGVGPRTGRTAEIVSGRGGSCVDDVSATTARVRVTFGMAPLCSLVAVLLPHPGVCLNLGGDGRTGGVEGLEIR